MRTVRVIPCLDVEAGRVVKGVRFKDLRDAGDPAELASRYDAEGADEVVFLDITASQEGRSAILATVARSAEQVFIPLTVGGGVRSLNDATSLLRAGADKVAINTSALERPELVTELATELGSQCVVVAVDARRSNERHQARPGYQVFTHGGRRPAGVDAIEWAKRCRELGAGEILLTSMDRDGTRSGYDLELTRSVSEAVDIPVIASGGVGSLEDLAQGALVGLADGLLAASVFHLSEFSMADAKAYLASAGVSVRP